MKSILLAATVLSGLASTAFAADAVTTTEPVPAPAPVASTFDWTGAYAGAQAGYEFGRSHVGFPTQVAPTWSDPNPSGFVGGIYVGYNHEFQNRIVLGAEADLSYSHGRGDDPRHDFGVPDPISHWKTQSDWNAALRGRVGYAFDRTLVYAAGGVAFTNLKTSLNVFGAPLDDVSETRTGWTIGVGIEHAFTERLLARIEYRYADFGTKNFAIPRLIPFDVSLRTQDIRVGLAYKF